MKRAGLFGGRDPRPGRTLSGKDRSVAITGLVVAVALVLAAPASARPLERQTPEQLKPLLLTASEVKAATGLRVTQTDPTCFLEPTFTTCQVVFKPKGAGLTVNGGNIQSYATAEEALAHIQRFPEGPFVTKVVDKTPTSVTLLSVQPTATYYSKVQAVGTNVVGYACKKGKGTTAKEGFACVRSMVKAQVAKMR